MKQIVVIHGGSPHASYEDYISTLKQRPVSLDDLRKDNWRIHLQENLGDAYTVLPMLMPCKENAKYNEWKIWFERFLPLFEKEIIFVGHSLGAIFLAKYLSEEDYEKDIQGLFLVAPPFKENPVLESLADFIIDEDKLTNLNKRIAHIYLYYSTDDPVVPMDSFERYKRSLASAEIRLFTDRGHIRSELPEIIEDIKRL